MANYSQQQALSSSPPANNVDLMMSQQAAVAARSEVTSTGRGEKNFPAKLWDLLVSLEAQGLDHIVSWAPHGRCFVVRNQEEFVSSILPVWFRQTKFTSFQRQLNIYGFTRLTAGKDKHGYYHPLFLRNDRALAKKIDRHKLKGTGTRKPGNPESEPNFYAMPYIPAPMAGGAAGGVAGMPAYNDRAREDRILAQLLAAQGQAQPLGPNDFSMLHMQNSALVTSQEAMRLAAARRAATMAQLQQHQELSGPQLDLLLAQARLKASMGMTSPGLRMPQLGGGLSQQYDPSLQMQLSNAQQQNDALRRALLQNSFSGGAPAAQSSNPEQQQQQQQQQPQQEEPKQV